MRYLEPSFEALGLIGRSLVQISRPYLLSQTLFKHFLPVRVVQLQVVPSRLLLM